MGASMGKNTGNILDSLPSSQGTLHIVMLGLDSAGKTTALYRLKFDQYLNTVPTIGFNCEKIRGTSGRSKGSQFLMWDVGGQEKLRPLWRSYTRCTDGIIFVVDSVDMERMEEAKMELMRTAKCPDNYGVPVLVLANKQDLPNARDPKEIEKLLSLHEISLTHLCSVNNFASSISISATTTSSGFMELPKFQTSVSNQNIVVSGALPTKESDENNQSNKIQAIANDIGTSETTAHDLSAECFINEQTYINCSIHSNNICSSNSSISATCTKNIQSYKGWFIQPACAITGEGLQEGLDALYDMIMKKRKIFKSNKKKR